MEELREKTHGYILKSCAHVIKEQKTRRRVIFPCTFMYMEGTMEEGFESPIIRSWLSKYGNQLMENIDLTDISITPCNSILSQIGNKFDEYIRTVYSLMFIQVIEEDGSAYFVESSNLTWNIRAIEYGITVNGFGNKNQTPLQHVYDILLPSKKQFHGNQLPVELSPPWYVRGRYWREDRGYIENMCTDISISESTLHQMTTAMRIKYPNIDVRNMYITGTPYSFVEDIKDLIWCARIRHEDNSRTLIIDNTRLGEYGYGYAINPIICEVGLDGEKMISTFSMVAPHYVEIPNIFLIRDGIRKCNEDTKNIIWEFFHMNREVK